MCVNIKYTFCCSLENAGKGYWEDLSGKLCLFHPFGQFLMIPLKIPQCCFQWLFTDKYWYYISVSSLAEEFDLAASLNETRSSWWHEVGVGYVRVYHSLLFLQTTTWRHKKQQPILQHSVIFVSLIKQFQYTISRTIRQNKACLWKCDCEVLPVELI